MLAPKRSRSDADETTYETRTMITAVTVSAQPSERTSIRPPTSNDGGRDLAQNAKQDHQIHVSRTIGQNALHSRGAGSLFLCHLVDRAPTKWC